MRPAAWSTPPTTSRPADRAAARRPCASCGGTGAVERPTGDVNAWLRVVEVDADMCPACDGTGDRRAA